MGHNCKESKLYVLVLESEGLGERIVVLIKEEGKDKRGELNQGAQDENDEKVHVSLHAMQSIMG